MKRFLKDFKLGFLLWLGSSLSDAFRGLNGALMGLYSHLTTVKLEISRGSGASLYYILYIMRVCLLCARTPWV